jgi:hypothetical protein
MKTIIKEILPRQDDDGTVINVKVQFKIPEKGHRNNTVEATIFIDKNVTSLDDINRLAVEGAIDLFKRILDQY